MPDIPLSVLDLASITAGGSSSSALNEAAGLAVTADELGYRRFWVAEHHNMPTVASTSPAVLIAHIATQTQRIKVGSGGVMLPNHSPMAIAEQFALLEALHPGRIDLGIGRAPGSDRSTMSILRRGRMETVDEFPSDLLEVMAMLGDIRISDGLYQRVRATPVATSQPWIGLLGSSDFSARLAARLGLPFAFAHHFDVGGTSMASALYRNEFVPSAVCPEPHLIVTVSALAAATAERARWLSQPSLLRRLGIRTGRHMPVLSPEEADRHPHIETARTMPTNHVSGDPTMVAERLDDLVAEFGADELMIATTAFSLEDRRRNLELIRSVWSRPIPTETTPS